ncbi:MAG: NYN domain-containing protein, partial [Clostridia bacterium]|nr:NYN domain-containing protein [Clostridia bacterium]
MAANIAILIDAENVDPSFANQILSYARSLGEVTVREIYGSGISLNEWADPILENTIHTNFTLRPNKYKNSSDIALTIGAMELLSTSRATEDK